MQITGLIGKCILLMVRLSALTSMQLGQRGEPETQALGRSVGGFSTKVHIKAEGLGKPMHFVLSSGERHEAVAFPELVKGGKVGRPLRGRPKHCSRYLVGDKAYSSQEIRQRLRRSGTTAIIPKQSNEKRRGRFNPWTLLGTQSGRAFD